MKRILFDGMFYARGRVVYLNKKPNGVCRYLVYSSLEPLVLIDKPPTKYRFSKGEVLEACTDEMERIFYEFVDDKCGFKRLFFNEISEECEGEDVLLRHFGLQGLKPEDSLSKELERWLRNYK